MAVETTPSRRYKTHASGDASNKPTKPLGWVHSLTLIVAWLVAIGNAIATTLYVNKALTMVQGGKACLNLTPSHWDEKYQDAALRFLANGQRDLETFWYPSEQREVNLAVAWTAFVLASIAIGGHFQRSVVGALTWMMAIIAFICSTVATQKMNVNDPGLRAHHGWCWKDGLTSDDILSQVILRRDLFVSVVVLSAVAFAASVFLSLVACATCEDPGPDGPDIPWNFAAHRNRAAQGQVYPRPSIPSFRYSTSPTIGLTATRPATPPPAYTPTAPENVRQYLASRRARPDPTMESGLVVLPTNTSGNAYNTAPFPRAHLTDSRSNRSRNTSDGSNNSTFVPPRLRREDSQHTLVESAGWSSSNPYRVSAHWEEPRWDKEHSNGHTYTRSNRANSADSLAVTVVESDEAAETSYRAADELESGGRAEERMPGAWRESSLSL